MNTLLQCLCLLAIVVTGQSNARGTEPYIADLFPEYLIIDCSVGSTSAAEWQKGGVLYDNCADAVMQAKNNGYEIVGLFHFQGEADTGTYENASTWKTLTRKFFMNFRVTVGEPDLPIVYAQIGAKPAGDGREYWETVKVQQKNLNRDFPEFKIIYTDNITPYCPEDGLHWCPAGYERIAKRFQNKIIWIWSN